MTLRPLHLTVAILALGACSAKPSLMEDYGGDSQAAFAGLTLDLPFVVRVHTQPVQSSRTTSSAFDTGYSDPSLESSMVPMEGAEVHFSVVSGGGSVADAVALTDADGYAFTSWTLGSEGPQSMEAAVYRKRQKHLQDSPFTYTANIVTPGSFTDPRDGETYATITVGGQTWMAENLRYKAPLSEENPAFPDPIYGLQYRWATALEACPEGWHLPSDAEFYALETLFGYIPFGAGDQRYGRSMKSTEGWADGGNGSNVTGFNAYPTGDFYNDRIGYSTKFWTSTEFPDDFKYAFDRSLSSDSDVFSAWYTLKIEAISVRCVQD